MKKLVVLLILCLFTGLYAEDYGTIKGRVTDKGNGSSLVGVNIIIVNSTLGASTDVNGFYKIEDIPVGNYTLKASFIGYKTKHSSKINVTKGIIKKVNFELTSENLELEEISVLEDIELPMKAVSNLMAHRSGDFFIKHNTEEYSKIDESGFFNVINKPLSTFAADIDGASYSNARRFIMQDQLPYKDAVRSEEFINYFSYDYKQPAGKDPLSINLEYSECPWNKENSLIHIGLQGKILSKEEQKPSNLVFLLDVSGSMNSPKKLPLLKKSFKLLVDQLNSEDRVAIVVYAGSAGLVLPSTSADDKRVIINSFEKLSAGGSTAGGAGVQLAYKIAKKNFIKDGNNRVILATDGDFNVGISSTSELVRFIENKRDDGIFLTVLGFGMGNYKDDRLQELADRGNGNHAYIDNILEAKKVLVNEVTSTLFTIAKDVKIQVEFNPAKIESYRLIGYENRILEDKDFTDDKKDAGEIGAGHTVTALYEIVPAKNGSNTSRDLKYQHTQINDGAYSTAEIMTVKIRYKEPIVITVKKL
jgi:Ca-activated chloride channel homolog